MVGPGGSNKDSMVGLNISVQMPHPRTTPKLHFPVNKLQIPYLLACENNRFSLFFAAGNVPRRGTSVTQRQKVHTDDANKCLHNKSGSHGVPNITLFNFACLQVDFGEVLCSSANELQQNSNVSSREDYIPQILTVLLEIISSCLHLIFVAFCLLSVIRKQ